MGVNGTGTPRAGIFMPTARLANFMEASNRKIPEQQGRASTVTQMGCAPLPAQKLVTDKAIARRALSITMTLHTKIIIKPTLPLRVNQKSRAQVALPLRKATPKTLTRRLQSWLARHLQTVERMFLFWGHFRVPR